MSLTSDDLADIKHLLEVTINAALKDQDMRIDARFEQMEAQFEQRFEQMDTKLDTILDAVGTEFNDQQEQIDDHEHRLIRLEKKAA